MPFLKEKTPKFHDFASATIAELYKGIDQTTKYEANTLSSGVLINDGDGKFEFRELPTMAQVAPVNGIAVSDFDADGNLDLVVAQNSHAPQVETGYMAGGVSLLLLGKGDGSFSAVRPDRSGLVVAGDAKGVAMTDLNDDGWQDLLVAVNGGELQAYEIQPPGGANQLLVELSDMVGAVGARISVRLNSGKTRVKELYSGGGYLSQSSSRIGFTLPRGETAQSVVVRWADGVTSKAAEVKGRTTMSIDR